MIQTFHLLKRKSSSVYSVRRPRSRIFKVLCLFWRKCCIAIIKTCNHPVGWIRCSGRKGKFKWLLWCYAWNHEAYAQHRAEGQSIAASGGNYWLPENSKRKYFHRYQQPGFGYNSIHAFEWILRIYSGGCGPNPVRFSFWAQQDTNKILVWRISFRWLRRILPMGCYELYPGS